MSVLIIRGKSTEANINIDIKESMLLFYQKKETIFNAIHQIIYMYFVEINCCLISSILAIRSSTSWRGFH